MAFKKSSTKETGIKYEVVEDYGVLSSHNNWETRLRLIKWNDREEKYDIRPWSVDENGNEKCGKGITLTGEEMQNLLDILQKIAEE